MSAPLPGRPRLRPRYPFRSRVSSEEPLEPGAEIVLPSTEVGATAAAATAEPDARAHAEKPSPPRGFLDILLHGSPRRTPLGMIEPRDDARAAGAADDDRSRSSSGRRSRSMATSRSLSRSRDNIEGDTSNRKYWIILAVGGAILFFFYQLLSALLSRYTHLSGDGSSVLSELPPQSPNSSPPSPLAHLFSTISTTLSNPPNTLPYIHLGLVASCVLALRTAYFAARTLSLQSYLAAQVNAELVHRYKSLWRTRRWWVLSLLVERWLLGAAPGNGMWQGAPAAGLRSKRNKSSLRTLARMGIYPLAIQDGGFAAARETRPGFSIWGRWRWGRYTQRQQRAVFEFVVPSARGWNRRDDEFADQAAEMRRRRVDQRYFAFVLALLGDAEQRRATRWRVQVSQPGERTYHSKVAPIDEPHVPVAVGATSRFAWLLPFKRDRVLEEAVAAGPDRGEGRDITALVDAEASWLLTRVGVPHVRIEAADAEARELDRDVLELARALQLGDRWDGDASGRDLRREMWQLGLDEFEALEVVGEIGEREGVKEV